MALEDTQKFLLNGLPPGPEKTNLYIRNDPDSREAYYKEEEPEQNIEVSASLGELQFIWDRKKAI
jgi:hypothetical protein